MKLPFVDLSQDSFNFNRNLSRFFPANDFNLLGDAILLGTTSVPARMCFKLRLSDAVRGPRGRGRKHHQQENERAEMDKACHSHLSLIISFGKRFIFTKASPKACESDPGKVTGKLFASD
jgi:hypothetical protein